LRYKIRAGVGENMRNGALGTGKESQTGFQSGLIGQIKRFSKEGG